MLAGAPDASPTASESAPMVDRIESNPNAPQTQAAALHDHEHGGLPPIADSEWAPSGHVAPGGGSAITEGERGEGNEMAAPAASGTPSRRPRVRFDQPVRAAKGFDPPGWLIITNFLDHDPARGSARDHNCGKLTYDGHRGTDFSAWPFAWDDMDNDRIEVVAAAEGIVVAGHDGESDRTCALPGASSKWNFVDVRHDDGTISRYGHLKKGSLTRKRVGQRVARGEYLGRMGSSGYSTGPHLHFEVWNAAGQLVDPWGGSCGSRGEGGLWASPLPYRNPALNRLLTHSTPPRMATCPDTQDTLATANLFEPGDTVFVATYFVDLSAKDTLRFALEDPHGRPQGEWAWNMADQAFSHRSWWWWGRDLPRDAREGRWKVRATFQGKTYTHEFQVVRRSGNPPERIAGKPGARAAGNKVGKRPGRS